MFIHDHNSQLMQFYEAQIKKQAHMIKDLYEQLERREDEVGALTSSLEDKN